MQAQEVALSTVLHKTDRQVKSVRGAVTEERRRQQPCCNQTTHSARLQSGEQSSHRLPLNCVKSTGIKATAGEEGC
jgi:hypothetical protein